MRIIVCIAICLTTNWIVGQVVTKNNSASTTTSSDIEAYILAKEKASSLPDGSTTASLSTYEEIQKWKIDDLDDQPIVDNKLYSTFYLWHDGYAVDLRYGNNFKNARAKNIVETYVNANVEGTTISYSVAWEDNLVMFHSKGFKAETHYCPVKHCK